MTITKYPPNTIWLGGTRTEENQFAASEAITPGHLIEMFNSSGVHRWRKHTTAGGNTQAAFATEQSMLNLGVDDAYAAGDLVEASIGQKGSTFWALIASGQNITFGQKLESAGDGTLKAIASGTALATALETVSAVALSHLRVEVL